MNEVHAAVVIAQLTFAEGVDPAAVGAVVSDGLCGSWEHGGPCRWPHQNEIDPEPGPARFRTVIVAPEADLPEVLARIEHALRGDRRWTVLRIDTRPPRGGERDLVDHLASLPRLAA